MDNLLDGSSVTVIVHNVEVGHSTETLQGMRQCCYDNHWTLTSHTNLAAKKTPLEGFNLTVLQQVWMGLLGKILIV